MDKLDDVIKGLKWILEDDKFGFGHGWSEEDPPECEEEQAGYNIEKAIELLKEQQPKKGHWEKPKFADDRWHQCSVCGVTTERLDKNGFKLVCNYCRVCGADMRKDGEQE